jgi:glycine dehydrogenase subunit 1
MTYIANTREETREMLESIGVGSIDELFSDIPESIRLQHPPGPHALSEMETLGLLARRASWNRTAAGAYSNFMGAGSYEHFIPAAVQAIAQRGEFLTSYTPYQPEASQGTLQVVYEFQTMICSLTGMDVANASMYDGASALAEAALMAIRITDRNRVLIPASLHPAYRQALVSYTQALGVEIVTWETGGKLDWPAAANETAAVVVQHPNFFGYVEPCEEISALARKRGALVIAVTNPMSLSVLEPPGAWGADIAVGEAQPVGLPMNFGGPYAGFMACRQEHIRKMPGRIVGRSVDGRGRDAFVLTLQTREQHIRRERATSNICTNQGLCATMVTLYLALIGKGGLARVGDLNLLRASALHDQLVVLPGVEPYSDRAYFNEFTVRLPMAGERFYEGMRREGVLPGLPAARLGYYDPNLLIVCATETKDDDDLNVYLNAAMKVLET